MLKLLTACVLALAAPAAALAQMERSSQPPESISGRLDRFISSQPAFNGTVLVARGGHILLRKGYGLANVEHDIPNIPETPMLIGSLTKQFTAAAILILADRGALKLDDSICLYIERCPQFWNDIKIQNLLDHSSGIVDVVRLPGAREASTRPTNLEARIEQLREQPAQFPVGTEAQYGNSGFVIAARIIEIVSGKTYEQFLDDNIYTPLGMTNSGYARNSKIIRGRANGYSRSGDSFSNAAYIDMSVTEGAGSQYSSADDMYAWDKALHEGRLFSQPLVRRMFTPSAHGFGLGWEVTERFGRRLFAHNGNINGFGAYVSHYPDDGVYIVVMSNVERTPAQDISDGLAAIVLGQ